MKKKLEYLNQESILEPVRKDEVLYAQADGSMILTRERGWGEVKLGRVFKSSNCIHAGEKPDWISNSQYIAHLGGHRKFTGQMDSLLDSYGNLGNRLVFISDGAPWIGNWIADAFPSCFFCLVFIFFNCPFKQPRLTWLLCLSSYTLNLAPSWINIFFTVLAALSTNFIFAAMMQVL